MDKRLKLIQMIKTTIVFICMLIFWGQISAQEIKLSTGNVSGPDLKAVAVNYLGKPAIRIDFIKKGKVDDIAIVKGTNFKNGTVEVELAGERLDKNDTVSRVFIGVAFRVHSLDSAKRYECFYLRLTNGRAHDQLRRNHSTQYISMPGYDFARFRRESPGGYESYADMDERKWIKVKVVVHDDRAQLYVGGADQPCLVVNDLKHGISEGFIALKADDDATNYFRNLKITKEE